MKTPEETQKGLECCTDLKCEKDCFYDCPYYLCDNGCFELKCDAFTYNQQLEAQVPKWISVEERLPEEPGEVLMVLYGRVCIAWYHCDGRFESGSGYVWTAGMGEVTHWMPLPEPPKGE